MATELPSWFPATLDEQLLFATTPIFFKDKIIGTGFFYRPTRDENSRVHFLVTAFHVLRKIYETSPLRNQEMITIEYHVAIDGNLFLGSYARCSFPLIQVRVHPDISADLAAVRLDPQETPERVIPGQSVLEYWKLPPAFKSKDIFFRALSEAHIRTDKDTFELLPASAHVIMPGYPDSNWDEANRFPLLRSGTTAAHPALQFGGASEGRLDLAAAPVDSGAPVIARNDVSKLMQSRIAAAVAQHQPVFPFSLFQSFPPVPEFTFLGIYTGAMKARDTNREPTIGRYIKGILLLELYNWKQPDEARWITKSNDSQIVEHSSPSVHPLRSPVSVLPQSSDKDDLSPLGSASPLPKPPKYRSRLDARRQELLRSTPDRQVEVQHAYHIAGQIIQRAGAIARLRTPAIGAAPGGLIELRWWPNVAIFVRPTSVRCFEGQSHKPVLENDFEPGSMPVPVLDAIAKWLRAKHNDAAIWPTSSESTDDDSDSDDKEEISE